MASVTIRDVRKAFGSVTVIHGVDVAIGDGEFAVHPQMDKNGGGHRQWVTRGRRCAREVGTWGVLEFYSVPRTP